MKPIKMLDTFAGIGGFSYAAHKLVGGFETKQFIEIDPFCQKILNKHFPNVPIHDDIRTFSAISGQYDVICGGFPCQSLSVAGNRAGITEDSRSGIFYELMRVILLVRPKYIILENVAAILNNGLDIVLGELSQAGYDAEWSVISASTLGACHRRSRWWCVAYSNSEGLQRLRAKHELQESSEEREACWSPSRITLKQDWRRYLSKPLLSRGDDVIPNWIHRSKRIKALGNSLLPAVAAIPLQRVKDLSML